MFNTLKLSIGIAFLLFFISSLNETLHDLITTDVLENKKSFLRCLELCIIMGVMAFIQSGIIDFIFALP